MITTVKNLSDLLQSLKTDDAVGIKVGHLAGDDSFSFFGAEIDAGKSVSAHYHEKGIEIYNIVSGSGSMNIGHLNGDGQVEWTQRFDVKTGDCFTINPGQVHQLKNAGNGKLVAIFGCGKHHLSTDRFMVESQLRKGRDG